ncbi:MAG: Gfo/Idh/MocA family oxidoreductase [Phycisphaeraceae bacterium]|nr:Gfo/Idh/MocA family oxidoreductase [Phycisphaerales bacterium]MCB9860677.1 Gfo/Idh/MocA family oxidoreductase [Phycisphaeraceae bacterium]
MSDIARREFLAKSVGSAAAFALVPDVLGAPVRWNSRAPLRVGVVGAGRQGRAIAGELVSIDEVSVTAICDTDDRRLAAGLRRSAGATGFATVAEMLAKGDVDAVVVATPTHTHRDVAVAALQAGKHIYCECPLAHTIADCKAIADAAKSASVVAAAGCQGRANPVYQLARGFFKSDSVRDLVSMYAQSHDKTTWISPASEPDRYKAFNWKLDPEVSLGLAGEVGTQQFDVFHWYTDRYPVKVSGLGSVRAYREDNRKVNDTIALNLIFDDGTVLQYGATIGNSYGGNYEVFHGTNAAIKLAWTHGWMFKESDAPTQGWEVYANRQQFHTDEGITLIAGATKLAEQGKLKEGVGLPHVPVHYALVDWINAISANDAPACSIAEGARATAVAIAANEAVRSGKTVDIDLGALS